ncbi:SDR family NAD(P)-dependent oxidoreductase [Methylobacterium nonmethylotrophicum]|uniref:SDR family oxidoreductase n=1 Tax=Methylobacterium nonmethylotrophicum TaxID=1141884 RepID=A0A4Z0NR90_9HYPH|nr:SDR family oxidoreductase [Methylobacterium nonmethylotrophicum]TGD99662.1 SDR family oxidoreductase [Methylobacterium nonmethylotrophicum]
MSDLNLSSVARSRGEQLAGLIALVTGAGRGIGRACALACAAAGAEVIAVARTEADLAALAAAHPRIRPMIADVAADEFPARIRALPHLDILINNAGTNRLQPLPEVDVATLDHLLHLNVRSAFLVSQAAALRMLELGRGGSIVHISSQMGHVGGPKRAVYCMTKHAIEGLTKAMAVELASAGIRVNAVAPTIVETPMTAPFFEDPAYRQFALSTIPMGRVAQPEDVAEAVVYLASPAAGLVTGTSLRVDGGATAQ